MKRAFTDQEKQRIGRVRGQLHAFDAVEPRRTALLVIDMQNFFLEPGTPIEVPAARDIVPAVEQMAETLRNAGGTVVWIQQIYNVDDHAGHTLNARIFGEKAAAVSRSVLKEGTPAFEIWSQLKPKPNDMFVRKTRYSAFIQGSSDLHEQLRKKGIDTLLISGTVTNTCCESTARDAMMLDYRVIMLSDAVASNDEDEHWMTLRNIARCFGDVYSVEEAQALVKQARRG
jgi:ureidoacrylate peracid hydrolase